MKATWKRLENGVWGICVESALGSIFDAIVGQEIDVVRSDGNVSKQLVTKVVKRIDPRPAKRVRGRAIPEITSFLAFCEVEPREKAPFAKRATSSKRNGTSRRQQLERALSGRIPRAGTAARSTYNELRAELVALKVSSTRREKTEIRISPEEMAAAERCLRPRHGYNVDACGLKNIDLDAAAEQQYDAERRALESINFAAF